MGVRVGWIKRNGPVKTFQSLIWTVQRPQHIAAMAPSRGQMRIDAHGAIDAVQGGGKIVHAPKRDAAIGPDLRVIRFDFQSSVIAGQGFLITLQSLKRMATI